MINVKQFMQWMDLNGYYICVCGHHLSDERVKDLLEEYNAFEKENPDIMKMVKKE